MEDDAEMKARLLAAAGAAESPIDREEHASVVAAVVQRARRSSAGLLVDELLKRTRALR